MDSKKEPVSEAKERIDLTDTAQKERAHEEITRLKAELHKTTHYADFLEKKEIPEYISTIKELKAELERERELRKELVSGLQRIWNNFYDDDDRKRHLRSIIDQSRSVADVLIEKAKN